MAQRALPTVLPGASPPLIAEFVSDADIMRLLEMGSSMPTAKPVSADLSNPQAAATPWSQPSGSVWSTEETQGYLPSDLFGGQ